MAVAKLHHYHVHMCFTLHTQGLGENMPNSSHFSPSILVVLPIHTHVQTYINTYEEKHILKSVCESNSLGPSVIQKLSFWHFFAKHTNGKWCSKEESHPCHSQSQIVYAYHVLSMPLHGLVCTIFFWTDMKTEMCVFIYTCTSNIPQIMLILNIYGFMATNP